MPIHLVRLLVAFLFTLSFTGSALADNGAPPEFTLDGKPVPPVVATVNGVDLPSQFLENQIMTYKMMLQRQGQSLKGEDEVAYARETLTKLVDQELLYQKREDLGLKVSDQQVTQEIERITDQFPSKELFLSALAMQRLDLGMLRHSIEKKFLLDEFLRKEIAPKVKVGESDIKEFYRNHLEDFKRPERFTIRHIFVAAMESQGLPEGATDATRKKAARLKAQMNADAKAKAEEVYQKLKAGEDFEAMAKEYSEDFTSKDKGGMLGTVVPEGLFPQMAPWLKKLEPGQFSEPIKTPLGFHIMKVTERFPADSVPLEDVKSDIMNHLLREEVMKARDLYFKELRLSADIKIHL